MKEMTWEEKLQALNCLTETTVRMRSPGDWYCSGRGREVAKDGLLVGEYGNGSTPQEAVENDWTAMTEKKKIIFVSAGPNSDRRFSWNGFMWQEVRP